jgi:hypothetical protein
MRALHPAPRSGEGGPPERAVGGASAIKVNLLAAHPLHRANARSPSPAPLHCAGADKQIRSRGAIAPEFCQPRPLQEQSSLRFASRYKKGERSAERRMPSNVRTNTSRRCRSLMRGVRKRAKDSGRARLPALHRGTRQAGRIQHWLSSRPALPETRLDGRYPFSPVSSLPSTSETGRSAGRSGTQSRPGAECKSARGHRSRSAFRSAL